jgi:hypothetical protein
MCPVQTVTHVSGRSVFFDCFARSVPGVLRPALSLMLQDKPCPDTCSKDFSSCKQIYATSRRQAKAPQQVLEALIRAKSIKYRIDPEIRHPHGMTIICSLKPLKGLLFVVQSSINLR